jgi:asparaginyl-tRNA synthetase
MATPFHIDEAAGSDVTGQGTQEAPYQTLGYALYSQPEGTFLIRKDATVEYAEPTQSALKKAKKTADGIEKKKKKQEEQEEREKKAKGEEKEKREKLLEESKKIVLEEDSSLPKAKKVRFVCYKM